MTAELQGFTTVSKKGVEVNVAQTAAIDFPLKVAQLAETVNVTGATPLIETTSSAVGTVVDVKRIENMPLNGRQFANLAATVPGVGLSFHSDPTKSTQYAPLVNGGAGRNINYQIDGGDNNDDTVGGQLQAFPLEAIEQFNFQTQRFKAEYGRSNGGVLSVVTKSGTNMFAGSAFEFFRDKSMNALTETEKLAAGTARRSRATTAATSSAAASAARSLKDKAHFFFAVERTQSGHDADRQHQGTVPGQGRRVRRAVSRDALHRQGHREPQCRASSCRCATAATPTRSRTTPRPTARFDNWGDSTNKFNSINVNHNWVMGGSKLNEFIFQYADFGNHIAARSIGAQPDRSRTA